MPPIGFPGVRGPLPFSSPPRQGASLLLSGGNPAGLLCVLWGRRGEGVCTCWEETLAVCAGICSNFCMPTPDHELPPHCTPDHTSWPLNHFGHVGVFRGPDGFEVAFHAPDRWVSYGIWVNEDHALDVAYALYKAWDTVQNIPPAQMRALFEFFTPKTRVTAA